MAKASSHPALLLIFKLLYVTATLLILYLYNRNIEIRPAIQFKYEKWLKKEASVLKKHNLKPEETPYILLEVEEQGPGEAKKRFKIESPGDYDQRVRFLRLLEIMREANVFNLPETSQKSIGYKRFYVTLKHARGRFKFEFSSSQLKNNIRLQNFMQLVYLYYSPVENRAVAMQKLPGQMEDSNEVKR